MKEEYPVRLSNKNVGRLELNVTLTACHIATTVHLLTDSNRIMITARNYEYEHFGSNPREALVESADERIRVQKVAMNALKYSMNKGVFSQIL